MKFSIFPQYGALNSPPVFDAFKQGAEKLGHTVVEHDKTADAYVIWSVLWNGRMSDNQEIYRYATTVCKPIIILEVGALQRGTTWRFGLNHINKLGTFNNDKNLENGRSKKLGINLKDWRGTGNHVLICGQHSMSEQWRMRAKPELWLRDTVEKIKSVSHRKIVFRPHPRDHQWTKNVTDLGIEIQIPKKIEGSYDDFDHANSFKNAWCVVNPSSNTGIHAIIQGIPVFCDSDSLAAPVGNLNLQNIENPIMPDREVWLEQICHTEWTIDEIKNSIPISRFFDKRLDIL